MHTSDKTFHGPLSHPGMRILEIHTHVIICFYILKIIFLYFYIFIFFIFLNYFDALILKIIFKNKKYIILIYF
jgi:hypothetical protein